MKKYIKFFLIIFIFASVFYSCKEKKIKKIDTKKKNKVEIKAKKNIEKKANIFPPFNFTRGIYLTAYTVNSNKFKSIIEKAKKAKINTVVFDIKNMNGYVFFSQDKKMKYLTTNHKKIVDIKKTVSYLHKNGIRAVARIVMFYDQFLSNKSKELRIRRKDDGYWQENKRKFSWLDSSNPNVQTYLLNIIKIVAKSGIDEIQLDYIRFPTQGNQKEALFYFEREDKKLSKIDSLYIKRKREDIIIEFLKKVKKITQKYNITLGGDVFAITAWQSKKDITSTGQNIKRMTKFLDSIHPMIYSSHFTKNFAFRKDIYNEPYFIVFLTTLHTKNFTSQNCRVIPYIQANSWKVNYIPEYIFTQIQALKDAGANGFILWNASNKYDKTLNWLIEKNF